MNESCMSNAASYTFIIIIAIIHKIFVVEHSLNFHFGFDFATCKWLAYTNSRWFLFAFAPIFTLLFLLSFVVVSSSFVCDRVCLRAARLTLNNCYHQKVYIYNQHIYGLIYAAAAAGTAAVAVLNCCASTYCSFYFSLSLQVNRSVGAMPLSHYSL